ncbi:hypothetical protein ABK040_011319 [Willaertia magna]
MGAVCSHNKDATDEEINNFEKQKTEFSNKTPKKLLLLGAGDSGKSTIFRQLRRLFGGINEIPTKERMKATDPIIENIIKNMISLCRALTNEKLENDINYTPNILQNPNLDQIIQNYSQNLTDEIICLNSQKMWKENNFEMGQHFIQLWKEPSLQYCFNYYKTKYQVEESAPYYFNNLERIIKEDYLPLDEDILRTRIKTTGVIDQEFYFENQKFILIDVGGQRSERRKWLNHFENVDAILYVCSLSEFDQSCYEDNITNRMQESLKLFSEYIVSKHFENVIVYLIFNKEDIFENKIKIGKSLKVTFPNYDGNDNDLIKSKEFIENLYLEKDTLNKVRQSYFMVALDKDNLLKNAESIIKDIISSNNEL